MTKILLFLLFFSNSFISKGNEGFNLGHLQKKKVISLKGKWHFIWNKYVDSKEVIKKGIPKEATLEKVPGRWSSYKNKYPKLGFGTYITTLKNPPVNSSFLVKLQRISSSYKVYFIQKGKVIATALNGKIGDAKELSIPAKRFLLKNVYSSSGDITVVFHIANFFYRSGGFFIAPELGEEAYIRNNTNQSFLIRNLISGLLFMMTVYHMALFLLRRSDKASLTFSGFCGLLFLRGVATEGYFELFFEMTSLFYSLQKKVEFISFAWSAASVVIFFRSVLGNHFLKKTYLLASSIGIIFTLFILVTPPEIFSNNLGLQIIRFFFVIIAFSILIQLGLATKRKENYASIMFYPVIFALGTFFYELVALKYNFALRHASSFGFSIFVFSQSYILAKKFNKAYKTSERLSKNLQEEVDIQTKEAVDQKNRAIKSEKEVIGLLHNMKQAVFAVGEKEIIVPPVSQFGTEIFEQDIEGKSIFDVLFKDMDKGSEAYSMTKFLFSIAINEDSLQYDALGDTLPEKIKRLKSNGEEQTLKITYSPILENDICKNIMLVIEDITEVLKLEKEVAEEKERASLKAQRLQEIVSNSKKEIKVFFREVNLQLEVSKLATEETNLEGFFRSVHTVKGSARIYNLSNLSEEIHLLENTLEKIIDAPDKNIKMNEAYKSLESLVHQYLDLFKEVYGKDIDETMMKVEDEFVEIPKDLFLTSIDKIKKSLKNKKINEVFEELKKIEFEDLKVTLNGLHNVLKGMASSLGKIISLKIEGDEVYLNKRISLMVKDCLMHIIQNSADHGIEKEGHINLNIKKIEDKIELEISDNGQGIDAELIHKKALEKGLVKNSSYDNFSKKDKLNLIMMAGFSTKSHATEYSGRGVGMDVVKTNINKLGGNINIDSNLGEGTTFKINIPYEEAS